MNTKRPAPPSQHEVERQFRELLKRGEVDELASWLDVPYDTLSKHLNPGNANKSDFYKGTRTLWALAQVDEDKARQAIELLIGFVFPAPTELQIVNRMESDLAKLKARLTEKAA